MIYTHENHFFVANARNILEAHGIKVFLKNEHASSIMGEAAAFHTWVELWLEEDADYDRACAILESALSDESAEEWCCPQCQEDNDAAFEMCWNCGYER